MICDLWFLIWISKTLCCWQFWMFDSNFFLIFEMTILRFHLGFWFSVLGLVTEIWRKIIFRLLLTNSIFFFPFFAPEWACGLSHILWKDFRARLSVLAIIRFGMSPSPMRKVSRNLEDWSKSHCDAVPSAWHEYRLWQGSWKERNRKEVTKSWTSSWVMTNRLASSPYNTRNKKEYEGLCQALFSWHCKKTGFVQSKQ